MKKNSSLPFSYQCHGPSPIEYAGGHIPNHASPAAYSFCENVEHPLQSMFLKLIFPLWLFIFGRAHYNSTLTISIVLYYIQCESLIMRNIESTSSSRRVVMINCLIFSIIHALMDCYISNGHIHYADCVYMPLWTARGERVSCGRVSNFNIQAYFNHVNY